MGAPHSLPISLSDIWSEFQTEIQTEADEYAKDGWTTQVCTVGEVRPTTSSEPGEDVAGPGLRILLPDNHFETLSDHIDKGREYRCETYRRSMRDEVVFLLLVYEFTQERTAMFIPLFYSVPQAESMIEESKAMNRLITQFRTLNERQTITLEHDDPSLLLPDEASKSPER